MSPELIAQQPACPRDDSRLLVCNRQDGSLLHRRFRDILELLSPADLLVFNDTKVIPARLFGEKVDTGTKIELLLVQQISETPLTWQALAKPGRRLKPSDQINFSNLLVGEIQDKSNDGLFTIKFDSIGGSFSEVLRKIGQLPTPPYIERPLEDQGQYQTIYAKQEGAIAAPTAGLHFTTELLARIVEQGTKLAWVTLHVGLGTFKPVVAEQISEHVMHAEWYNLPPETVSAIQATKARGGRVIAVGTTTTRVLETVYAKAGEVTSSSSLSGWTEIFIAPPYQFKCVDVLLTNFHLPKSTLLMLVAAFAGKEFMDKAYQTAIANKYRFYSFGDAMLIV